MWEDWEGLAAWFLDEAGIGSPVDPWLLAWALDLEVLEGPRGCRGYLLGSSIYVDPADRIERQGFTVGHECSHVILRRAGLADTEDACDAVTSCLLMPLIDFTRDLRQLGGDLFALRGRHPYASHEAVARRIVSVTPSVAWVRDQQRPPRRIVSPGLRWPHQQPTPVEAEAMAEALRSGLPAEPVGGVRAWPVIEPGFERVIAVSAADALGA